jgi:CRISPR-associated protein Csb3
MAEASIPVDLRNPGQVFACLGLMEAAHALHPEPQRLRREPVTGRYDWEEGAVQARFTLSAPGEGDPVGSVVGFLTRAHIASLNAPADADEGVAHTTAKWDVATEVFEPDEPRLFPFQPPDSPATLPIRLFDPARPALTVPIGHWGDEPAGIGRDNVKFWAGSGGYPGAALARDALQLIEGLDGAELAEATADPFNLATPQSSSFSFDWRRSYTPLDAGFSPNAHGAMTMVGFPLVELLAAIGLQNARPDRPDRRNKLAYRYAVTRAPLPLVLARPVLGCAEVGFPIRTFTMQLGWPGQEGQARCIKDSRED